ncbi:hypothetical protein EXIGLDRAFT_811000 [Exidia glandulosa HHB12029]|uniref:F-box domain-containing protein n=1 Tax=Exidia glandulosa HHB12029 TaxID=1314781 RepID=A0A165CGX3_EXIGL|nr:hypothetical protein EXIGLDRAFT_811000 [Exidia glandulosa HHB12029]
MSASDLPPELILNILEHITVRDLLACVVVSRAWSACARPVLFRTLKLPISGKHNTIVDRVLAMLRADRALCCLVRHLHFRTIPGEATGPYIAALDRVPSQIIALADILPTLESVLFDAGALVHGSLLPPVRGNTQYVPAQLSISTVKYLHYTSSEDFYGPPLRQLLTMWPHVASLHLRASSRVIQDCVSIALPYLRALYLDHFYLPQQGEGYTASFLAIHIHNLTHLQLKTLPSAYHFPEHDLPNLRFLAFCDEESYEYRNPTLIEVMWQRFAHYRSLETLLVNMSDVAWHVLPSLSLSITNFGIALKRGQRRTRMLDTALDFVASREAIRTFTLVQSYLHTMALERCETIGRECGTFSFAPEATCATLCG